MPVRLGGPVGVWLFRKLSQKPGTQHLDKTELEEPLSGVGKLERYFGTRIWEHFAGKAVLDFGCGSGFEAVAVAARGAARVYGIDIQEWRLRDACRLAERESVGGRCVFLHAERDSTTIEKLKGTIDCAYSLDSFEHYADPALILRTLNSLLKPGGSLHVSFGPPWRHPRGGHMFFLTSVPWFHLIFSESAILTVRAEHRKDGARSFGEVEGGLNQMTIARFLKTVAASNFQVQELRLVPIHGLALLTKSKALREYFTSTIRCTLVKPTN
jgi:2-polyprenyl-3-methyl-5-hydroxy-6-metoxy-1,4-benzoquinol methylase